MTRDGQTDEVEYLLCEGPVPGLFVSGTASEQRGYDRAIAEVVAWLREHHDGRLVSRIYLASAIEAGEHKP